MENFVNKPGQENNPYKAPQAKLFDKYQKNVVDFKLYKISSIYLATFLGSLIAGAVLLAINFKRLGKPEYFIPTILAGVLFVVVMLGIDLMLPHIFPGPTLIVIQYVVIMSIAKMKQERDIQAHICAGGSIESNWKVVGISLLLCILIVLIGGILFALLKI